MAITLVTRIFYYFSSLIISGVGMHVVIDSDERHAWYLFTSPRSRFLPRYLNFRMFSLDLFGIVAYDLLIFFENVDFSGLCWYYPRDFFFRSMVALNIRCVDNILNFLLFLIIY